MTPRFVASPERPPNNHEALRRRWVDLITGRDLVVPSVAALQTAVALLDSDCEFILKRAETVLSRTHSFIDHALNDEAAMVESFVRLQTLSKAWATPGSRFHQSTYVRNVVLTAVQTLHGFIYHAGAHRSGNWWSWEIGSAKAFADILAIFRDHIDALELRAYCEAIDYFVPDPWVQQGSITSVGANRVDLCQTVIVRSILTGDEARLKHSIRGLSDTWQHVTSGDGFYRDGSFVQHNTIGYTGTYGVVLLDGLSRLFALLAGSTYEITDASRSSLDDAVEGAYAPFIYRGQMMDAVRGRAISREHQRSLDYGDDTIEAILRLSLAADPATAMRWRGLCKRWVDEARSGAAAHDILAGASVVRASMVNDLMQSGVVSTPDTSTGWFFPAMDRLVHRGSKGAWTFTIAMSSRRIAWYECGNGENDLGAQTSSGMTYLYVDALDDHFEDEFWSTADLSAPPGTTVDLRPLPPRVEGQWGVGCPQNDWSGGAVLDGWSLAGQHLIAPGDTGLSARKTWLAGPDFVTCLGSAITTASAPSDDEGKVLTDAERGAKTVVEHRNTGLMPAKLIVDGRPIADMTVLNSPSWAHLPGTAGYVFLADATVSASIKARSGAWRRINVNGSATVHTRYYATIEIEHPTSAVGEYAYLVLPTASESTTRSAASAPPVSVLENTAEVQAVVTGDVTAANFWRASSVAGITVDGPASVIIKRSKGAAAVAVSDPTQKATTLVIELSKLPSGRIAGEGVVMISGGPLLRVEVDVAGRGGIPVTFRLYDE